jgi:hypothetical protein
VLHGMPRPLADLDTQPFWDGCREGKFLLQLCESCGDARWPPGPMCPSCQSTEVEWVESAGRGRVYSWIVANHPVHPDLAEQDPYVVALIELEHGVRVVGNIAGCEPDVVEADMLVELYFEDLGDGEQLPNFRVAAGE